MKLDLKEIFQEKIRYILYLMMESKLFQIIITNYYRKTFAKIQPIDKETKSFCKFHRRLDFPKSLSVEM